MPQDNSSSVRVLVGANLVPIAGVAFLGWKVHEVVFLYWIENLIIGGYHVLRLAREVPDLLAKRAAKGYENTPGMLFLARMPMILVFIAQYGIFCFVHGEFLASMFPAKGNRYARGLGDVLEDTFTDPWSIIAILVLIASHGYAYWREESVRTDFSASAMKVVMLRPYKRMITTHVFIIAGGIALAAFGSPVLAMIIFVGLKIAIDAWMHDKDLSAFVRMPGDTR